MIIDRERSLEKCAKQQCLFGFRLYDIFWSELNSAVKGYLMIDDMIRCDYQCLSFGVQQRKFPCQKEKNYRRNIMLFPIYKTPILPANQKHRVVFPWLQTVA